MNAFQELLDLVPVSNQETSQEAPQNEAEPMPGPGPVIELRDPALTTREQFQEMWDHFPLALKLHYGSLALEDARDLIKPKES